TALKRDVDQLVQHAAGVQLADREIVVPRHEGGDLAHVDFALEAGQLGAELDQCRGGVFSAIVGEVEEQPHDVLACTRRQARGHAEVDQRQLYVDIQRLNGGVEL